MRLYHLSTMWFEWLLVCCWVVILLYSGNLLISFMSKRFYWLFHILVCSGRCSIYSKQLLLELFLFSLFFLLLKLYCCIVEGRAGDSSMMEPFSSFLLCLLHAVHWTSDTSQFTLLSHGRVYLVSLNRGRSITCQRQMRFWWLLLVLGCVFVQKMLNLIKVFV